MLLPTAAARLFFRGRRWRYGTAAARAIVSLLIVLSSLPLSVVIPPGLPLTPAPAFAANFTVTTTSDTNDASPGDGSCADSGGQCSLRAAIEEGVAVAGTDNVTLPAGTYTLTLGELHISGTVNINGAGAAITTINAGGASRALRISAGTGTVSGVTITGAATTGNGGGILVAFTSGKTTNPTVSNSVIANSQSTGFGGGGVYVEGGASLTLTNTTVSGNTAALGGGLAVAGTLNANGSTISGNSASAYGGGMYGSGTLTVKGSTVSGNTTPFAGGGIANDGGILTLANSTVSGNTSNGYWGGGLYNQGAGSLATIANATISGNSAAQGAGIYNYEGAVTIKNTIVAGNPGGNCAGASFAASASNLSNSSSCGPGFTVSGSIGLGALGSNGGPTQTHAITASSTAYNAGNTAICAASPVSGVDQRGITRPQGTACDIGAFEFELSSNADLNALSLSNGTLSPTFAAATTGYAATVGLAVASITVTPVAAHAGASIQVRVNGGSYTAVVSGAASGALSLNIGSNTVDVLITAANSFTTKTYTITVTRADADFTVTSTTDAIDASPGDGVCATAASACTLRAAVMEANALPGAQIIAVPAGTYTLTLAGTLEDAAATGDLDIASDLTIRGAGADTTFIQGCNVAASTDCLGIDRIVHVLSGVATVSGVTIRNGSNANVGQNGNPGAGIFNLGTLTLTQSAVTNNRNPINQGGGVFNSPGATLTIDRSAVTANHSGFDGAGIHNQGTLTVVNSTISGNRTDLADLGFAGSGGGIRNWGAVSSVTIINSTVADNHDIAGNGGLDNTSATGTVLVTNSIVANNGGRECGGPITTGGHNISSDATCSFTGTGDLQNTDPLLSALASNSGTTVTHAIPILSPAFNAGRNSVCAAAPVSGVDQRGTARPQGANCDIGAYEAVPVTPTTLAITAIAPVSPFVQGGVATFSVTVQAQNASGVAGTVSTATSFGLSIGAGNGTLGGVLSGTIAAGAVQTVVTGVTYDTAEGGVVVRAAVSNGEALTPGISAPFTVSSAFALTVNSTDDSGDASAGDGICDADTVTAGWQCTLRAAIEEANAFGVTGVITVPSGTYDTSGELDISTGGITLQGPGTGTGVSRAIVRGQDSGSHVLTISANNVTVEGLELTFAASGSWKPVVRIGGGGGASGAIVTGVTVTGNAIHGGGKGINIANNSTGNTLSNNEIYGNDEGIALKAGANTNTIQNNDIHGNQYHGIRLDSASGNTVQGNTIANSTSSSGPGGSSNPGPGAIELVHDADNNQIVNNTVSGNAATGIKVGVQCCGVDTDSNTLRGNTVTGNVGVGILLQGSSGTTTVHRNTLAGNSGNVQDDGINNVWHAVDAGDGGDKGNFYSDYAGADADSDGIGDTPHPVPGTAGASDPKPLYLPGPSSMAFIGVNPLQTAPGATVGVVGGGFGSGATVDVALGSTSLGTATANSDGAFRVSVTVPVGTAAGSHTVTATDGTATATTTVTVSTPFTVNSTADAVDATLGDGICATASSVCTLRAAVQEANASATARVINMPAGTYPLGIAGCCEDSAASGDLDIAVDITIVGAGAATTILDGGGLDRLFHVLNAQKLELTGLTLRNGSAPDGAGVYVGAGGRLTVASSVITANATTGGYGGGIYAPGGSLVTITGSTVSDNSGGYGGGINTDGWLTVTGSTFSGNTASAEGGAVSAFNSSLSITDSTFSGNRAAFRGGAVRTGSSGTISGSTFNGNSAGSDGGALIHFCCNAVTVVNSTFSSNSADAGGQGGGAVFSDSGDLAVINSTIYGNGAPAGGGLYRLTTSGTTVLKNTIVAGSTSGGACGGPGVTGVVSGGHNVVSDTTCNFTQPGDQQSVDPLLGPLANNGGPAQTHLPQTGSPAISGGSNALCTAAPVNSVDQRGQPRPQGSACDIGSVELTGVAHGAAIQTSSVPTSWEYGETRQVTVMVTNSGDLPWNASAPNPFVLVAQFAAVAGGTPITQQIFTLPADLAAGASHTFSNIAITAPLGAAGVLEFMMVQQGAGSIPTKATVNVAISAPSGTINATGAPSVWIVSKAQTFSAGVTNTGASTWPASGADAVVLRVRFVGGADKLLPLPAPVAPGGTTNVSVVIAAPATMGATSLEFALVKLGAGVAFGQTNKPVTVTVALAAAVTTTNVPPSWALNKAVTFIVPVQNTGGISWSTSGPDRVTLRSRIGSQPYIYTDLPGSVAPNGTATVSVTLVAPAATDPATVELAMVHAGSGAVFGTQTVNVTVAAALQGTVDTTGVPVAFTANKPHSFGVAVNNTGPLGGGMTWTTTGATRVLVRAKLGSQPFQYFDLPGSVAPGGSATVNVTVTAPAALGAASLELALVQAGQTTPFASESLAVTVSAAVQGSIAIAGIPGDWTKGRLPTASVQVSNTAAAGGLIWTTSGVGRVLVRVKVDGLPYKYYDLPGSVAPGANATVALTGLGPIGTVGSVTVDVALVQAGQTAAFATAGKTVQVKEPLTGTLDGADVPSAFTAGKPRTFIVDVSNTAAPDGDAWQTEGAGRVIVRAKFEGQPVVYADFAGSVAPGAAGSASITLTAPATAGATTVTLDLLPAGTATPFRTVTVNVEVVPALRGTITTAAVDGVATGVPVLWTRSQPRTFTVKVANTALADGTMWTVSGAGRIVLRARIGTSPYQYVDLAGSVAPGSSGASLNITLVAPNAAGSYPVELALLPAGTSNAFAPASVNVAVRDPLAASISSSGIPLSWSVGQTATFDVIVTNTGMQTWNAAPANPVVLVAKFVQAASGAQLSPAVIVALGGDVAPDGTATLPVTLTAPAGLTDVALDFQMMKQGVTPIPTNLRLPVTAAP